MSKHRPERRTEKTRSIGEQEILKVMHDLRPRGLDASMSELQRIEPALHRALCQRAQEAVQALGHLDLGDEDTQVVSNAVEWAGLVVTEAVRRSFGAARRLGRKSPPKNCNSLTENDKLSGKKSRTVTAYTAAFLHGHQPKKGATSDTSVVGFSLLRGKGIADHIALPYPEALKLIRSLIAHLVEGGCKEAIAAWGQKPAPQSASSPLATTSPKEPDTGSVAVASEVRASDGLVYPEMLKWQARKAGKLGRAGALKELAAIEPGLAQFIEQEVIDLLMSLFERTGASPEILSAVGVSATLMAVTAIKALRLANFNLWRETAMGTRLAQFDPKLALESDQKQLDEPGDG